MEKLKQYFRENPLSSYEILGLLTIYGVTIVIVMLLFLGQPAFHP